MWLGPLLPSVYHMAQCKDRMMIYHSRAGVPHDILDTLLHSGLITVHGAVCAGRFLFLKRALIKAHLSVIKQLTAVAAETASCRMVVTAKDPEHRPDGLFLPHDT